ncbi:MAG: AAA family ATPase [Pseudanabaena sp. ELA748]
MSTSENQIQVMPYSMMVGQEDLKLALELAFIAPKIGGVLLSGDRGTGKSTLVRSFGAMVNQKQPITLPINATEDRVVGGWDMQKIMTSGELIPKKGLLEQAHESILYIDEVNLLDDRIVNIILDVSSTGILNIEQEGQDEKNKQIDFCLVGTMNPNEGGLRPQLLDRFGLMVQVVTEQDEAKRSQILKNVLLYEAERFTDSKTVSDAERKKDLEIVKNLNKARELFQNQSISDELANVCAKVAKAFATEGHRADYIMALAAIAHASLNGKKSANAEDVLKVARFALQHRQRGGTLAWDAEREQKVKEELNLSVS